MSLCVRLNGWGIALDLRRRDRGRAGTPVRASTRSCCQRLSPPTEVVALDLSLTQVEQNSGLPVGHIGIEAQIETARGLLNVEEICAASPRLEAVVFGPADFAASIEMPVLTGGVQIETIPAITSTTCSPRS